MRNPDLDAQVSAILRRAAERVAAGWCQGWSAQNARGVVVHSPLHTDAARFCATGAVYRAAYELAGGLDMALYDACLLRLGKTLRLDRERIALSWNDAPERQQAEVVEALLAAGGVK